jgi:hypothetical protein
MRANTGTGDFNTMDEKNETTRVEEGGQASGTAKNGGRQKPPGFLRREFRSTPEEKKVGGFRERWEQLTPENRQVFVGWSGTVLLTLLGLGLWNWANDDRSLATTAAASEVKYGVYYAQAGDTFLNIATKNGMTLEEILLANITLVRQNTEECRRRESRIGICTRFYDLKVGDHIETLAIDKLLLGQGVAVRDPAATELTTKNTYTATQ